MTVALGLRSHSGWAALVALGGPAEAPAVIERRRIVLADPRVAWAKQPYHAAEGLPFNKAEKMIGRSIEDSRRLAREELGRVVEELRKQGHRVAGCGLLMGSGRPTGSLAQTLASHALIHTAEGEMFRNAVVHGCEHWGVPVHTVREKEVLAHTAAGLGMSPEDLRRRLDELGRGLGPPWQRDHKLAAAVAWPALAGAGGLKSRPTSASSRRHG